MIDLGLTYRVEVLRKGAVVDTEDVHNLVPLEGASYYANAGLKGGQQYSAWYLGVFSGNYTPQSSDKASTLPAAATEFTDYEGATRAAVVFADVVDGNTDNTAQGLQIKVNSAVTLYGGFVSPSAVKGSTADVLVSAVRFTSPKQLNAGESLRISIVQSLLGV